MSECERKGRLFGGCHFKLAYDEHPVTLPFTSVKCINPMDLRALMVTRTFAGSVCVRCGKKGEA